MPLSATFSSFFSGISMTGVIKLGKSPTIVKCTGSSPWTGYGAELWAF